MNKNVDIDKIFKNIDDSLLVGSIACIEQLLPVLEAQRFSDGDILILSYRQTSDNVEAIVPTLSIFKLRSESPEVALNINRLWHVHTRNNIGNDPDLIIKKTIIEYLKEIARASRRERV